MDDLMPKIVFGSFLAAMLSTLLAMLSMFFTNGPLPNGGMIIFGALGVLFGICEFVAIVTDVFFLKKS